MQAMIDFLSGKKTYLTIGCALLVLLAGMQGWIDPESANKALEALGLGAIVAVRAAIAKQQAQAAQTAQLVASLSRGSRELIG